jgi:hypothetical protein
MAKFFWRNFLPEFLTTIARCAQTGQHARVRYSAERALPRLICFGEDFQARPAFEAGYIGIALDPNAAPLHWILACRAERRIGTQRVVVFYDRVDFRKQDPAGTI